MDTRSDSSPVMIISASPAQVPDLAPADEASRELARRTGALAARLSGGDRPIELVASQDHSCYTGHAGSFRAWGAPQVDVGHGHHLPELVARYVLDGLDVSSVRPKLGRVNPVALTVVVADGSAGMTTRAPLALLDDAPRAHQALLGLLRGEGLRMSAAQLADAGVLEPGPWLDLAAWRPLRAELDYSDTHLGVGRYLAAWRVGHPH